MQDHHAVIRNTTLAYNVVVDAMWLYLLQTVNTDMDHLTFEHNMLVHGPANTDIPQQGAAEVSLPGQRFRSSRHGLWVMVLTKGGVMRLER
jgi:hypothetical protein